jgi:hypothetical protein
VIRIRTGAVPARRFLALLPIAAAASLATGLASAPPSDAYWVCPPTGVAVRAPDFRCNGDFNGALRYIEKDSSPRAYGVYRSAAFGGGSVNGQEYFSGSSDYFVQDFGCSPGYPGAHNRNSVNSTVQYTLAGTC